MKTVAVFNNKGGVGKTTLAAHIVYRAEARGVRTLALAMDRQGDLPKWLSGGDAGHRDGSVFKFGKHVTVVYSPDAPPRGLTGVDLVVVDTPASIDIAATVTPDLWIAPCDGRMAIEDLGNVLSTMLATGAGVVVVFNRAEAGGVRTLDAMRRAAGRVPHLTIWPDVIPDCGPIKRAGEYYVPAWDTPYGDGSRGAVALMAFADGILDQVGVAGPRPSSRRTSMRA